LYFTANNTVVNDIRDVISKIFRFLYVLFVEDESGIDDSAGR